MSTLASGSGTVAEAKVDPAVGLAAGAAVEKLEGADDSTFLYLVHRNASRAFLSTYVLHSPS